MVKLRRLGSAKYDVVSLAWCHSAHPECKVWEREGSMHGLITASCQEAKDLDMESVLLPPVHESSPSQVGGHDARMTCVLG